MDNEDNEISVSVEPEKDDGDYETNKRNCHIENNEEDDEESNATINDATTIGQLPKIGIGSKDKARHGLDDSPFAEILPGTAV